MYIPEQFNEIKGFKIDQKQEAIAWLEKEKHV